MIKNYQNFNLTNNKANDKTNNDSHMDSKQNNCLDWHKNLQMSVSAIVTKDKEKRIYVQFTDGVKEAEGVLPGGKIIYNKGFSDEEKAFLETYIKSEEKEIVSMAKGINPIKALMK